MTIAIDASRANKPNKTGTEWYSWHIIEELKKIAQPDDKFLLYANSALTGGLEKLPENFVEKDLRWPPKYLWTQLRLWWELWRNPPDVLLVPAHTIPFLPLPKKIKVCVNVHDVGFKRNPELYKPIQVWYHDLTMKRIKSRANVIITISEFSKQEIIDLYGVKPEKIKVVYLGFAGDEFSPITKTDETVLKKYNIVRPYLLYVGRLEKKKNIANMIAALALAKGYLEEPPLIPPLLKREDCTSVFSSLAKSEINTNNLSSFSKGGYNTDSLPPFMKGRVGEGLKLVLAGSSGNQFEEIKKIISDQHLEQEVIITGYVDQEDLPALYGQAEIFLFPTLYEGFGLPILEAMASGVPVVTSNQPPHTEVGGEAAVYVDPHSPESLSDAIIKVLADSDLKRSLIEKGLMRAKEFSWQKTAEEVLGIIITPN